MEVFSEDIIIIYSLAFVGIMFLTLILLIISMIVNARRHNKVHSWTIHTHNQCKEIKTLCQDVKSSNNRKLDDITKLLYAQSSKIDNDNKAIINRISDLSNCISQINGYLKNLEILLITSNTKLDSLKKEQVENWNQLKYLQSFKEQVSENKNVFRQIQETVSDIEKQEQILNGMVKQHTAIADYSKEIVKNQEGVVKLLEALMLDTLGKEIDNIKK